MHGGLFSEDGVTLEDLRKIDRNRQPPDSGKVGLQTLQSVSNWLKEITSRKESGYISNTFLYFPHRSHV